MIEVVVDPLDEAVEKARDFLKKHKEYIEYLETVPEHKRTFHEKELIKKYGSKKAKKKK